MKTIITRMYYFFYHWILSVSILILYLGRVNESRILFNVKCNSVAPALALRLIINLICGVYGRFIGVFGFGKDGKRRLELLFSTLRTKPKSCYSVECPKQRSKSKQKKHEWWRKAGSPECKSTFHYHSRVKQLTIKFEESGKWIFICVFSRINFIERRWSDLTPPAMPFGSLCP